MTAFQSTLVAATPLPSAVQLAFQPPPKFCQVRGNWKPSVQPFTASVPVFVMSMLPTYPLPQSAGLVRWTAQPLTAGVPVTNAAGAEDQDASPTRSLATTVT